MKQSPLAGKTALFCGDSISFGATDRAPLYGWAGRLAGQYGLLAENVSQSGWSLSTIRTGRVIDQLFNAPAKPYDYVVLHGGVNDGWGDGTVYAPPGNMSDSFDVADYDVHTYAGALEELFHFACGKYPGAKIGYIINFATPKAEGIGHLTDMEDYYAEGLRICQKWGIPCLDLYHDREVNDVVMEVTTTRYMADAVHPNAAGYDRLTPVIARWLEGLPAPGPRPALRDRRGDTALTLCPCGTLTGWQGTNGTRLTLGEDAAAPCLTLEPTALPGRHIYGLQWLGSEAVYDLPQPVDLTGYATVQFVYHLSEGLPGKAGQLQLALISEGDSGYNLYFGVDWYRAGWHVAAFSLRDDRLRAAPVDLSAIRRLRFTWFNHNACMDSLTVSLREVKAFK